MYPNNNAQVMFIPHLNVILYIIHIYGLAEPNPYCFTVIHHPPIFFPVEQIPTLIFDHSSITF